MDYLEVFFYDRGDLVAERRDVAKVEEEVERDIDCDWILLVEIDMQESLQIERIVNLFHLFLADSHNNRKHSNCLYSYLNIHLRIYDHLNDFAV